MAKVMILGSGGREHSLAKWFSGYGHEVTTAPGNGGTSDVGENLELDIKRYDRVAEEAVRGGFDLVVSGPEGPLCGEKHADLEFDGGIADYWAEKKVAEQGPKLFGPKMMHDGMPKGPAMLEGSKIFARNFAQRHGIPQPAYVGFRSGDHETNLRQAISHLEHRSNAGKKELLVTKADGLCGGKGVVVCDDEKQVLEALRALPKFKGQGDDFILEEKLVGEEASITVVTDGNDYVMFPHSQDHKRRFDDDKGLNTGGMGAYAPTRLITPTLEETIRLTMIEPTIEGMQKDGMVTGDHPVPATIYFAVMVVDGEPKLIEYNMRFGDPETQVILPLMDGDPYDMMMGACEGRLGEVKDEFAITPGYTACVVLVSEDYQNKEGRSAKGEVIRINEPILETLQDVDIIHAGTRSDLGKLTVSGGRVLGVTAFSEQDHADALKLAYAATDLAHFRHKDMRSDIGYRVRGD